MVLIAPRIVVMYGNTLIRYIIPFATPSSFWNLELFDSELGRALEGPLIAPICFQRRLSITRWFPASTAMNYIAISSYSRATVSIASFAPYLPVEILNTVPSTESGYHYQVSYSIYLQYTSTRGAQLRSTSWCPAYRTKLSRTWRLSWGTVPTRSSSNQTKIKLKLKCKKMSTK